jgi:integrase
MNAIVKKIIKSQEKTSMFVFPGKNGQRRSHIHKQARRLLRLAGIPDDFRPCHGLRHFYVTELASAGHDIKTISALMGHKNITITNRYLNARDTNLLSASKHMANITGG